MTDGHEGHHVIIPTCGFESEAVMRAAETPKEELTEKKVNLIGIIARREEDKTMSMNTCP